MEIKRPTIFSATQKSNPDDTLLLRSIERLGMGEIDISFALENKESLPKVYNMAMQEALMHDSDCLILVHDDVTLDENPIPKLEALFDMYDLVGVAGTSKAEMKSPALWHLMGAGNLHGQVWHKFDGYDRQPSNFGGFPHRAVMIDGVFMALGRKVLETIRFDENNPSKWHFYDLSFSLSCHNVGHRVGVGNVCITHESPGLREYTEEWKQGEQYFLKTYGT